MTDNEALQKFQQADELYRQGFYIDALALLDQLDACYPKTRHVMFPQALCLYRLGRLSEAEVLCREIIERFNYPRARVLQDQIQRERLREEAASASSGYQEEDDASRESSIASPGPSQSTPYPYVDLEGMLGAAPSRSRTGLLLTLVTLAAILAAAASAWWALARLEAL